MNYWYDCGRKRVFYASVILTDVEDPNEPPMVVNLASLMSGERFIEVPPDAPEYPSTHVDISSV